VTRLLVTGANGQLGRALTRRAPDAASFDRASLDVSDTAAVAAAFERVRPDVVVHAAAWTDVDGAETHEGAARAVNVDGTRAVAAAAARVDALLVYVSSDYVFSGDATRPYREDDPTGPLSAYGRSKLDGEREAAAARHLIVRTSWVYGDGRNFVRSILAAAATTSELTVVDDQVGRPTHAGDLAGGLLALAGAGATGTFHLTGDGDPCSWADFAEAVVAEGVAHGALARAAAVRRIGTDEYLAGRAGTVAPRPRYSVLDCSRATAAGVTLRPWREALTAYVRATVSPEVEVG
jgi:dTDP-4-dehydrorhamnose 3,5-epimerase